jgi:Fe-S-cluster containining protein
VSRGRGRGRGGLRFECTRCGQCCRVRGQYAHVYLSPSEERALADILGLSLGSFRRRCTFVDEDGWRQLTFTDDRCVFLDDESRCTVYPARPMQCATFPFWRELVRDGEWTRRAHRLCEGIGCGRLHSFEEAEARMIDYELVEID